MAGTFVKCVYKFDAEVDGDLSLEVGDIVPVTKVVSDDWFQGTLNGKSGQFPRAFVEETSDKPAKSKDIFDVAIAVSSFTAEHEGDLTLNQGEVIVITEVVDENWAIGYTHGGHKGSFPRAFVKQISFEDSAMKDALQAAVPSFQNEITELDDEEDNDIDADEKYLVLEPFLAQSETELNLVKGVFVEVTEVFDDFWLEGKLENGKTGIFPRTCIDFPEDKLPVKDNDDEEKNSNILQTAEEVVTQNQSEEDVPNDSSTDFYAVAIFDYNSSTDGDLSFVTGDRIRVIKTIDENWYQGELSGNKGVFPSNHVETLSPEETHHKTPEQTTDNNLLSVPESAAENIEDELSDTESFPPPPSEDVLSDLEEANVPETHLEKSKEESSAEINNNLKKGNNNVASTKESPPPKPPPVKKSPPSRPTSGPKKPDKPKVPKQEINIQNSNSNEENDIVAEKPKIKKKAPPERPKMPALKKDTLQPFSFKFDTESQPTVIISGKYVKQGLPNVIILRKS